MNVLRLGFYVIITIGLLISVTPDLRAKVSPSEKPSKPKFDLSLLKKIVQTYSKGKGVKADLVMRTTAMMTGDVTTSRGLFYSSKDLIRIDFSEPNPIKIVYDGEYLWNEQPDLFSKKSLVTKSKTKSPLSLLLNDPKVLSELKVDSFKKGQLNTVKFNTSDSRSLSDFKSVEIRYASKEKLIFSIETIDVLENTVKYIFSRTKLNTKHAESLFKYIPPKGADINEL